MKNTIKNNITKIQRSIAYVLLLSELLTSCGFNETILPRIQPQAPSISTCGVPKDTSLVASDKRVQQRTTTVKATTLTFADTPEAGLYQDPTISPAPVAVAHAQHVAPRHAAHATPIAGPAKVSTPLASTQYFVATPSLGHKLRAVRNSPHRYGNTKRYAWQKKALCGLYLCSTSLAHAHEAISHNPSIPDHGFITRTNYEPTHTFPRRLNTAPTNIVLSKNLIGCSRPIGSTVGFLRAIDSDTQDTHTYTLVPGDGDTAPPYFYIKENRLLANRIFTSVERGMYYTTRIIATDSSGLSYTKPFSIQVAGGVGMQLSPLSSYPIPSGAWGITLSSNGVTAFVAAKDAGLQILNVSNLTHLTLLGNHTIPSEAYDVTLSSDGSTAFVAAWFAGLQLLDVSNLTHPTLLGNYITPGFATGVTLSSDGSIAFVAAWFAGLQLLDVSNLTHPTLLGHYLTPGLAADVTLSSDGSTTFVAAVTEGLQILNLSNLTHPTLVSSYAMTAAGVTLSSDEHTAFVGASGGGLQMLDVSKITNPTLLGSYATRGLAYRMKLSSDENTAFVGTDTGLEMLRIAYCPIFIQRNPPILSLSAFRLLGSYATPGLAMGVTLSSDGSIAFVAARDAGLQILDVRNITHPKLLGNCVTLGQALSVTLSSDGATAFVAADSAGLQILDVRNLTQSRLLGNYTTLAGNAIGVTLSSDGATAFVAANTAGLQILDVRNLTHPTLLGNYPTPGYASGVTLSSDGATAFVAANTAGLQILDIRNLTHPTLLGNYAIPGQAWGVTFSSDGATAFVAAGTAGLQILDVSDPTQPTLLGNYAKLMASYLKLSSDGSTAFVAAQDAGVQILDVSHAGALYNVVSSGMLGNTHLQVGKQTQLTVQPFLSKTITLLASTQYSYDTPEVVLDGAMGGSKSWIEFYKVKSELRITPPKDFSGSTLQLILPITYYPDPAEQTKSKKYYQTFDFPVSPSLTLSHAGQHLAIESPEALVSVQIEILGEMKPHIDFIEQKFGALIAAFDKRRRLVDTLGSLYNINDMLKGLRYDYVPTYTGDRPTAGNIPLQLTMNDGLNVQQVIRGDEADFVNLGMFLANQAPQVNFNNPITDQFSKQSVIINQDFELTVDPKSFTDPESDPLTYRATKPDGEALPDYLQFDAVNNKVRGNLKASISFYSGSLDLSGLTPHRVRIYASDGYKETYEDATIQAGVSLAFILNGILSWGSILVTAYSLLKYRDEIHAFMMKGAYEYHKEDIATVGEPYELVIPLVNAAMHEAYDLWKKMELTQRLLDKKLPWFTSYIDESGKIKKAALLAHIQDVLKLTLSIWASIGPKSPCRFFLVSNIYLRKPVFIFYHVRLPH